MEAELVSELPEDDGWQYEPKWDGFRGILENLDGEVHLWSRNARPLLRYFPELAALGGGLPPQVDLARRPPIASRLPMQLRPSPRPLVPRAGPTTARVTT